MGLISGGITSFLPVLQHMRFLLPSLQKQVYHTIKHRLFSRNKFGKLCKSAFLAIYSRYFRSIIYYFFQAPFRQAQGIRLKTTNLDMSHPSQRFDLRKSYEMSRHGDFLIMHRADANRRYQDRQARRQFYRPYSTVRHRRNSLPRQSAYLQIWPPADPRANLQLPRTGLL